MELLANILTVLLSGIFGAGGVLFFYKANLKKANAEARNQEIKNLGEVQETYQKLILDLKSEIAELNSKVDKLENKILTMCDNCRYKRYFNEKN